MIRTLLLVTIFCLNSASVYAQKAEAERVKELNSFTPILGVWEGFYELKWIEPSIDSGKIDRIYIRIEHGLNDHAVSLAYSEKEKLQPLDASITMFEDQLGWVIHVQRSGGVWIEKYILTFARTSENQAESTLTRTVHNWHMLEGESGPNYFSTFGQGTVTRDSN
jgi:hypothetical protein